MVERLDRTNQIEQRRYARAPLNSPVSFSIRGTTERRDGLCKDISIGGTFVETTSPAGFNAHVIIHITLPGAAAPFAMPGVVRWVERGGMGIQFGSLGAVETHIITEICRKHSAG